MSNFKPQITVLTVESQRDYDNCYSGRIRSPYKVILYDTYANLKKELKKHLSESLMDYVAVSRSRRGEWGEWYEHWELKDGKPYISKSGWM